MSIGNQVPVERTLQIVEFLRKQLEGPYGTIGTDLSKMIYLALLSVGFAITSKLNPQFGVTLGSQAFFCIFSTGVAGLVLAFWLTFLYQQQVVLILTDLNQLKDLTSTDPANSKAQLHGRAEELLDDVRHNFRRYNRAFTVFTVGGALCFVGILGVPTKTPKGDEPKVIQFSTPLNVKLEK